MYIVYYCTQDYSDVWCKEEKRHQDLLKRVREDKQLWTVKYIKTSIAYPVTIDIQK